MHGLSKEGKKAKVQLNIHRTCQVLSGTKQLSVTSRHYSFFFFFFPKTRLFLFYMHEIDLMVILKGERT